MNNTLVHRLEGSADPHFSTKPSPFGTDEKNNIEFFDVWANKEKYKAKTSGRLWVTINKV